MGLISKTVAASIAPNEGAFSIVPDVLVPLAVCKVKAPHVYHETVCLPNRATAVLDFCFDLISEDDLEENERKHLDRMEMTMYLACHQRSPFRHGPPPPAYRALNDFASGDAEELDTQPLSKRLAHVSRERAGNLMHLAQNVAPVSLDDLVSRFDAISFGEL